MDEFNDDHSPSAPADPVLWLIVGWAWAGIPLALGVYLTILKSLPLFK